MRITVLGCGPAGLLVAHAAAQVGHQVEIISKKIPSKIGGAQYLHTHIPDLTNTEPDGVAHFELRGTAQGYAEKVYGKPDACTSWGSYQGSVPIWNMRRAYVELWKMYQEYIIDETITPASLARDVDIGDLVFSTIPRTALCTNEGHTFDMQEVWIWYGQSDSRENRVVYNGNLDVPWYRFSTLFGWESIEWPAGEGHTDLIRVKKPIRTNCDCLPGIVKLGRYGMWKKEVLSHDAYWEALGTIARAEQGMPNAVQ